MTRQEKEQFYKDFIGLFKRDNNLADTIISVSIGENEELFYGSLEFGNLEEKATYIAEIIAKTHDEIYDKGMNIHFIYLPFSVEPIHVCSSISSIQARQRKAFGIYDITALSIKACINELTHIVTEKFRKKAYSCGTVYRTLDHILENHWGDALKNDSNIDYFDSNN